METVRLDKWLWAVRVYKTRSEAADACRGSAVRVNGRPAKPSAKLRPGDRIVARTKALQRTLKVVGLTEKRVGAAQVSDFCDDRTPETAARNRFLVEVAGISRRHPRSPRPYSHSIVPGGFELMSSTTRLQPLTSLMMRLEIVRRTS